MLFLKELLLMLLALLIVYLDVLSTTEPR